MKLITGCLLFISSTVFAQDKIEPMINAETNFAEYSVEHGMKAAFLKFLDSNSVVFEKGHPVNGIESWHRSTAKISAKDLEDNMVLIMVDGLRK